MKRDVPRSSTALSEQIQDAMKAGDKVRLSVLRLLSTELKKAEVAGSGELSEDDVVGIIANQVRRREEAASEYEKGGRADRAEAERGEAEVLKEWLPEQLGPEELQSLVAEAIAETGATGPPQIGQVMKIVMAKVRGRADGRAVSDLVKQRLTSG